MRILPFDVNLAGPCPYIKAMSSIPQGDTYSAETSTSSAAGLLPYPSLEESLDEPSARASPSALRQYTGQGSETPLAPRHIPAGSSALPLSPYEFPWSPTYPAPAGSFYLQNYGRPVEGLSYRLGSYPPSVPTQPYPPSAFAPFSAYPGSLLPQFEGEPFSPTSRLSPSHFVDRPPLLGSRLPLAQPVDVSVPSFHHTTPYLSSPVPFHIQEQTTRQSYWSAWTPVRKPDPAAAFSAESEIAKRSASSHVSHPSSASLSTRQSKLSQEQLAAQPKRTGRPRGPQKQRSHLPALCDICGSILSTRSNLEAHKRIHTGEKPFVCNVCGYASVRKSDLKKHMRTHSGIKPYLCQICGRSFTQNSHLKVHMRRHSVEKEFNCSTCEETFSSFELLERHQRLEHSGLVESTTSSSGPVRMKLSFARQPQPYSTETTLGTTVQASSSLASPGPDSRSISQMLGSARGSSPLSLQQHETELSRLSPSSHQEPTNVSLERESSSSPFNKGRRKR